MAHQVTIMWDANSAPVSGYNVYRGTTADNESNVPLNGGTLVTTNTYTDNTVFAGVTYFYEITAVLNGIESEDSVEVRTAPVPFPPTPARIELGTANSFGVLAGSTVTNTGTTNVVGDVGVSPGTAITGFEAPSSISGAFHSADFVSAAGQAALTSAYNQAAAALNVDGSPATTMTGDIGGQRLTPGVYSVASSLGITGSVILDGGGDVNAVFIFQIGSTLTVAGDVLLVGGAQADNVFWQVGSSATIGVNSSFTGTIMAQASITANTGAMVNGRLLARDGAVTLDSNSITLFLSAELITDWTADTIFHVGQVFFDCPSHSFQWVITGGRSGDFRPAFHTGPGQTTQDGTVLWVDPPSEIFVLTPLPPSPPNVAPLPPAAPLNPRITSES